MTGILNQQVEAQFIVVEEPFDIDDEPDEFEGSTYDFDSKI
jgi:hypothetical protein